MSTDKKLWYLKNREHCIAYARAWQKANPEKFLAALKKYDKDPLRRRLKEIRRRCRSSVRREYKYYGGKGVQCFLTMENMRMLWDRDHAFLMTRPVVHRTGDTGDYTLANCQFIEAAENSHIRNKHKKI